MLDIYIVSPLCNSLNFYEKYLDKIYHISFFFFIFFTSGRITLKIMSLPCLIQKDPIFLELQF